MPVKLAMDINLCQSNQTILIRHQTELNLSCKANKSMEFVINLTRFKTYMIKLEVTQILKLTYTSWKRSALLFSADLFCRRTANQTHGEITSDYEVTEKSKKQGTDSPSGCILLMKIIALGYQSFLGLTILPIRIVFVATPTEGVK